LSLRVDDLQNETARLLSRVFEPPHHNKLFDYFNSSEDHYELRRKVRPHVEAMGKKDCSREIIDTVITLMGWSFVNLSEPKEPRAFYLGEVRQFIMGEIYRKPGELKKLLRANGLGMPAWIS